MGKTMVETPPYLKKPKVKQFIKIYRQCETMKELMKRTGYTRHNCYHIRYMVRTCGVDLKKLPKG